MADDSFSKLSTELVYMTLKYLDDPKDLYSLVRASSHVYRGTYRGSEDTILSNVLKNCIGDPILPDALISNESRSLPINSARNSNGFHVRTTTLLRDISKKKESRATKGLLPAPRQLAHLHLSVNYFIEKFSSKFLSTAEWEARRNLMPNAVRNESERHTATNHSLSLTELTRFQRAFYRYNTIQNLIQGPVPCRQIEDMSTEDIVHVLGQYTPWEVEEIACIHQHMLAQLRDLFRKMEDDFIQLVASTETSSSSRYLSWGDEKGSSGLESRYAEAPFFASDDYMFLHEQKRYLNEVLEYLASLGLPFLWNLFRADHHRRKELIEENYDFKVESIQSAFLLKYCRRPKTPIYTSEAEDRSSGAMLHFEGEACSKRNHAWLWAHQYRPQHLFCKACDFDLREWGYVFWDSDRLEKLGVMKDPRPLLYYSEFPAHYEDPLGANFQTEPSAQQRLREMGLA